MIPLDGMADLPDKQKQQLMDSMETMQAKDRCGSVLQSGASDFPQAAARQPTASVHQSQQTYQQMLPLPSPARIVLHGQGCACITRSDPTTRCCSLRLYNSLVERCFCECVEEFRRRELDVGEEKVRPRSAPYHALHAHNEHQTAYAQPYTPCSRHATCSSIRQRL